MAKFQQVFQSMHLVSRTGPEATYSERIDRLGRLERLLSDNVEALCKAISADFNWRSETETKLLEILPVRRGIRHAKRHLARWMKEDRRKVDLAFQPSRAWVRYEALGVVGIIAPWNYPLALAIAPLTDALAAGNRVMVKPSEQTPCFSNLLATLISENFASDEVSVVLGDVSVAQDFARLPFDHLLFTGSTEVGRSIMRAASDNLTPVTLELGGKSPAIICDDFSIDAAARSVSFGKFINAGQTCIAPDYALVPRHSVDRFVGAVMNGAAQAYPNPASNRDYTSIISERHLTRLRNAVQEAEAAGARIVKYAGEISDRVMLYPKLVIDPPRDSLLMREEIFGPVLPVIPYDTVDEAIAFVNAKPRPLALYLFTDNRETQSKIIGHCKSGGVTINGTLLHYAMENLPFGGIGASGMGAYHGRDGFLRFSHARAVHKVGKINMFEKLGPPWGLLLRLTLRILGNIR
ncbi:coniferyl aldehyde dehydrogenase [Rhizobium sp. FKY42]|uniref:coniferyl aldehyde dehydrogenase n=1 Tax=Rhizobium sp. FKY42 TaxID=2562310 RepID=UPI00198231ED|nr:coniferyl aldehyde dehydrogenase [Rhizobium sp. FKY42]